MTTYRNRHRAGEDQRTTGAAVPVTAITALTVILLAMILTGDGRDAAGLACLILIAGTVLALARTWRNRR